MSKQNIEESVESRVCFEELEDWVREKIQGWVQELLEEEVTELLGRRKSERRSCAKAKQFWFWFSRSRAAGSGTLSTIGTVGQSADPCPPAWSRSPTSSCLPSPKSALSVGFR